MAVQAVSVLPEDKYNLELVRNVHPADWVNPTPNGKYNLVVIGAGTAGLVSAAAANALGGKVALIERHLSGGDCLNVGCVPSKGLIRAGRAVADVRNAHEFGIDIPKGIKVDFEKVMERMRRVRAEISPHDSIKGFSDRGIDVFIGDGQFTGPRTAEVDGISLEFSKAVIATGARASAPPIPGLDTAGYLTNETLFSLTTLPKRLAIIGAGPIGCEMAQAFARFGSEVTMLEMESQVLPREPSHIAGIIQKALDKDGVHLLTEVVSASVETGPTGKIIRYKTRGSSGILEIDEILVSAGRRPNIENLGLDAAGVEYDAKSGVTVNRYLQTSNKRIYAAGDICFPYKFTHAAESLAAIAVQNALFRPSKKTSKLTIPWSTYTDPEVAHVGLYPDEAAEKGIETETFSCTFDDVDRAMLDGETEGIVELYVKKGTDTIMGATIVAKHAGDIISEVSLAITGGLGLGSIIATIHPYPTQAEAIRKAAREYWKSKLTPLVKKLFALWMKWHR